MAQIISLAPQRVVVNPILVGDERLVAVGVGGVRDTLHARPHAADVEAAELRFAEIEAIDDADLVDAGAAALLERDDVAAFRAQREDEAAADRPVFARLGTGDRKSTRLNSSH